MESSRTRRATVDASRQVDATLPKMILSYMRRAMGQEAVDRVLEMAGQRRNASLLAEPGAWTSKNETLALFEAAAALSGDGEIGRRVGEELIRSAYKHGQVDFIRSTGSIVDALAMTVNGGTKMSTGRTMQVVEAGEGYAILEGRCHDSADASRFWCGISAGFYGAVPAIFGATGVITEPECQARGDEACVYRLTWTTDEAAGPSVVGVDASRERTSLFTERFEQLHAMATELAQAEAVEVVLERLAERAGLAIDAPRFLFAIRARDGEQVQIYQRGFKAEAAARFAERLLGGDVAANERTVVADIGSAGHYYGKLGVLYPKGYELSEWDRRLVSGYARHAAASVDAAASLEAARHDRDTAQVLLEMATALAQVGSSDDVARRLAAVVPVVANSERAGVWLWDTASESLQLAASHPVGSALADTGSVISVADVPELAELARNPVPLVFQIDEAHPMVARLMGSDGLKRCAVAPLRARGAFLGLVIAGFADPGAGDGGGRLLERLTGLADQAATALDNAALLDSIRQQALHDALTGLPNRALVEDRATQALARGARSGGTTAVLFVDLDRFKNVNDTLGHTVGDEIIVHAGARLSGCLRATDTLGRLGGDEFVVLLPDIGGLEGATLVASKLLDIIKPPFELSCGPMFMSCSIGIAISPDHGTDYPTLLRHADAAMYQVKANGRAGYAVHSRNAAAPRSRQLELEAQLHSAISRGELRLLYQPQYDLTSSRIVGVEALVRWQHPSLGLLPPAEFLPIAEESGLIRDIDAWVRRTALAQARAWLDSGLRMRVAINLSTRDLRDPRLATGLADLLVEHDLDPALVELEITDRVVMEDDDLVAALEPLRALGVRLAIDDFGTGTSVLRRLDQCQIDTLKIDRSFVSAISASPHRAPVITALLAMADEVGLEVVAEGVETDEQADFLCRHGCHTIQGYLFSRPVGADEISRLAGGRDFEEG